MSSVAFTEYVSKKVICELWTFGEITRERASTSSKK
jgi:hypothetical protein